MAPTVQMIDGDGTFLEDEVKAWVNDTGVAESRANYQVVAIMGPQSSGKSTLMNHLFGTTFVEMDALTGRRQTTRGVWLAKSPKITDISTLVMDLEGSDGRERGEDDTNFERQAALFALAVADVLLVNIWCHDIGREHGSGKPLMKTIFQVNLKLFAPEPNRRKTVLLFVIRDKSKTPLSKLAETLGEDVAKMWDSISKPPQYVGSRIDDFFEIQYAGLPHYEEKYDDFIADSIVLRRRFSPPEDGDEPGDSLVRRHADRLPAGALPLSTANIWSVIRSQKDLNLPAHKIMVANVRCEDIKADQLAAFAGDQAWQALAEEAGEGLVRDFGPRAAGLKDSCVDGYDQEAMYFHEGVRDAKRADLLEGLAQALAGPFDAQMRHLAERELAEFDRAFRLGMTEGRGGGFSACARECEADALARFNAGLADALIPGIPELDGAAAREALGRMVGDYVDKAKHGRVKEAVAAADKRLSSLLTPTAVDLLQDCPQGLWPKLHAAKASATAAAGTTLQAALAGIDMSEAERKAAAAKLAAAGQAKLASLLQEAALTRVSRMRDAFNTSFTLDENKTPRTWMPRDNIDQLARAARRAAANTLASLCVARGADYAGGDAVERAVLAMAAPDIDAAAPGEGGDGGEGGGGGGGAAGGYDIASASEWPGGGGGAEDVLVTPAEARSAWREFMSASTLAVQQARITQQANLAAGKRAPPVWAMAAILLLGWNEFIAVVWNPIYLVFGLVAFIFSWMLYSELDVDARMQQGWITGLLGIWGGLGDALRTVSQRAVNTSTALIGEGAQMLQDRGAGAEQQQQQRRQHGSPSHAGAGGGAAHQQHMSSAGLMRRKQEAAGGVEMVGLAGAAAAGAAGDAKDE
ncbi:MAG: root hair defective 3 GTP-binding protein [Monoraphidium minutum]|nr:MAG: root hair defective 3 GTP-binding protein [Monoraphidium minutum]